MLKIKNEYKGSTIQVRIGNKTVMFDGSNNYSQQQLETLYKSDFFKKFITEVDKCDPEKVDRVIPQTEYPIIEIGELQKMSNAKLRETYPFAHGEKKSEIIDHILAENYGN